MDRAEAIRVLTIEQASYRKDGLVDRAIDMAITALREQEQSKWISVKERLPERDEQVLCRYVFNGYDERPFYQVLDYYAFDLHPHFQHEGAGGMHVTHWMPLPEPPKEGAEG